MLGGDEKADDLLPELFDVGSQLLLDCLPGVFSGKFKQDGEGCTLQVLPTVHYRYCAPWLRHSGKMSLNPQNLVSRMRQKYAMQTRCRARRASCGSLRMQFTCITR